MYLKKNDSPQYHTAGSQRFIILELFSKNEKCSPFISRIRIHIYYCNTVPLKFAKVLRNGCWLPGVMSDSPQYFTAGRLTLISVQYHTAGRFLRKIRNLNQNQKYLYPLFSGPGSFEWWKIYLKIITSEEIL